MEDMYVCLCFDVKDHEIKRCIRLGNDTLEKLQNCTGASTGCGMCYDDLVRILDQNTTLETTDEIDPEPQG